MKKEDITDEMALWWAHTHRTFKPRWQTSPSAIPESRDSIGWRLKDYNDFAETSYAVDWKMVQEWAFRILHWLTEGNTSVHKTMAPYPDGWQEVVENIRRSVQEDFANAVEDSEPGEVVWEKWISEPAAWVLENMTPFHVWCVYRRVMDDLQEEINDNALAMLDERNWDIAKVADDSFNNAMRGFDEHLNNFIEKGS